MLKEKDKKNCALAQPISRGRLFLTPIAENDCVFADLSVETDILSAVLSEFAITAARYQALRRWEVMFCRPS